MNTSKIKWHNKLIAFISCVMLITSCSKEYNYVPKTDITPLPTDTKVSFKNDIMPFFTPDCGTPNCHDATTKKVGLDFSSAAAAYTTLFTKGSIDTVANKTTPELNKLYKKISNSGGSVGSMQKYLSSPATQQALVLKWLKEGALNN